MGREQILIGVCAGVEDAKTLAEAGADFVEVHVQGFLKPEAPDDEFAPSLQAARSSALPVLAANCFIPGKLKTTGPDVKIDAVVAYAETVFERAGAAGIGFIVFGSGGSRSVPDGFPKEEAAGQLVDVLKRMAPAAERHSVTIVMEPLNSNECNILNSLAEAAEVVEKADHPNVKLLADLYHMAVDGEAPGEIARFGSIIRHVHVAEAEKRTAPGVEGDDFRPYLQALAAGGYSGGISMECLWDDVAAGAPKAVEYLRQQLADVGL